MVTEPLPVTPQVPMNGTQAPARQPDAPGAAQTPAPQTSPVLHAVPAQQACPDAPQAPEGAEHVPVWQASPVLHAVPAQQACPDAPHPPEAAAQTLAWQTKPALHALPAQQASPEAPHGFDEQLEATAASATDPKNITTWDFSIWLPPVRGAQDVGSVPLRQSVQRGHVRAAAAVVLLVAGACADPGPFLGSWRVSGKMSARVGTDARMRTVGMSSSEPRPDYRVTFRRADLADLESLDDFGCTLLWVVSGRSARSLPHPGCRPSTRRALVLAAESGELVLTVVDPGHLTVTGRLSGTMEEGGALLGRSEPASVEVDGVLTPTGVELPAR
jgi:hypothetical protein